MKTVKTRPEYPIFKVRILILIYSLLCILTLLFSRNFFINTLQKGEVPDRLNLIVFFTIPVVLMVVLGVSVFFLFIDFFLRRPGSTFNVKLFAYFAIIVIFSILPTTLMTSTALNQIIRYWHSIDAPSATSAANSFIADNYSLHLERFENILRQSDFSAVTAQQSRLPQYITAFQVFLFSEDDWTERLFSGNEQFRLSSPPAAETGFITREIPRDNGTIRYIQRISQNTVRLISYDLGFDFDQGRAALENQSHRFETIEVLRQNLNSLLIYYYIVFFLPTLLMTGLIAISFTRRITRPIIELTEATVRVAEGDFSIQILTQRNDELGLLIRSFNSMVQELEKSRTALLRSEKISVWQNMAQQLAHEIKNPLTPIKLSAERLLRRWRNNPENIGEILENSVMAIIQETEGLSALLDEFRTISKPMEPSRTSTSLGALLEEMINAYSTSYPKVKFDIEHIQTDIQIKMDRHRLFQILTNLIVNAIDSMNGNGLIEVRTDLVKKREICYCRISIKDSGIGISSRDGELIFTPYFTTKESGTGLGLPIIERIINDHDGAIWFDSAEGIGTTFYIDLPEEKILEEL